MSANAGPDCEASGRSMDSSVTKWEVHLVAITWAMRTPFLFGEAESGARAEGYVGADETGVEVSAVEKRPRESSGQAERR